MPVIWAERVGMNGCEAGVMRIQPSLQLSPLLPAWTHGQSHTPCRQLGSWACLNITVLTASRWQAADATQLTCLNVSAGGITQAAVRGDTAAVTGGQAGARPPATPQPFCGGFYPRAAFPQASPGAPADPLPWLPAQVPRGGLHSCTSCLSPTIHAIHASGVAYPTFRPA